MIDSYLERTEKVLIYIDEDESLGGCVTRRMLANLVYLMQLQHMRVVVRHEIQGYRPREHISLDTSSRGGGSYSTRGGTSMVSLKRPKLTSGLKTFYRQVRKLPNGVLLKNGSVEARALVAELHRKASALGAPADGPDGIWLASPKAVEQHELDKYWKHECNSLLTKLKEARAGVQTPAVPTTTDGAPGTWSALVEGPTGVVSSHTGSYGTPLRRNRRSPSRIKGARTNLTETLERSDLNGMRCIHEGSEGSTRGGGGSDCPLTVDNVTRGAAPDNDGYASDTTIPLDDTTPAVLVGLTPMVLEYIEHLVGNLSRLDFVDITGYNCATNVVRRYIPILLALETLGVETVEGRLQLHGNGTGRLAWTTEEATEVYDSECLRLGLAVDRESATTTDLAAVTERVADLEVWRYGFTQPGTMHTRLRRLEIIIGTSVAHEAHALVIPRLGDLEFTRAAYKRQVPCRLCREAHMDTLRDMDRQFAGGGAKPKTYHCHVCDGKSRADVEFTNFTIGNTSVIVDKVDVCSWCGSPAVWPTTEKARGASPDVGDEHLTSAYSSFTSPYAQSAMHPHAPADRWHTFPETVHSTDAPYWFVREDAKADWSKTEGHFRQCPTPVNFQAGGIPLKLLGLSPESGAKVISILHRSIHDCMDSYGYTAGETITPQLRKAEYVLKRRLDQLGLIARDFASAREREIADPRNMPDVNGDGGFPPYDIGFDHASMLENLMYSGGPLPNNASSRLQSEWSVRYYLESTTLARRFVSMMKGLSRNLHELRHLQVAVALVFGVDPPDAPPDASGAFLLERIERPSRRGLYTRLTIRFALEVGAEWYRSRVASPPELRFDNMGAYHMQLKRHCHRTDEGSEWVRSAVIDFDLMVAREGTPAALRAVEAVEAAERESARAGRATLAQDYRDWQWYDATRAGYVERPFTTVVRQRLTLEQTLANRPPAGSGDGAGGSNDASTRGGGDEEASADIAADLATRDAARVATEAARSARISATSATLWGSLYANRMGHAQTATHPSTSRDTDLTHCANTKCSNANCARSRTRQRIGARVGRVLSEPDTAETTMVRALRVSPQYRAAEVARLAAGAAAGAALGGALYASSRTDHLKQRLTVVAHWAMSFVEDVRGLATSMTPLATRCLQEIGMLNENIVIVAEMVHTPHTWMELRGWRQVTMDITYDGWSWTTQFKREATLVATYMSWLASRRGKGAPREEALVARNLGPFEWGPLRDSISACGMSDGAGEHRTRGRCRVYLLILGASGSPDAYELTYGLLRHWNHTSFLSSHLPSRAVQAGEPMWRIAAEIMRIEVSGYNIDKPLLEHLRRTCWLLEVKGLRETTRCVVWCPPPGAADAWTGANDGSQYEFRGSAFPSLCDLDEFGSACLFHEFELRSFCCKIMRTQMRLMDGVTEFGPPREAIAGLPEVMPWTENCAFGVFQTWRLYRDLKAISLGSCRYERGHELLNGVRTSHDEELPTQVGELRKLVSLVYHHEGCGSDGACLPGECGRRDCAHMERSVRHCENCCETDCATCEFVCYIRRLAKEYVEPAGSTLDNLVLHLAGAGSSGEASDAPTELPSPTLDAGAEGAAGAGHVSDTRGTGGGTRSQMSAIYLSQLDIAGVTDVIGEEDVPRACMVPGRHHDLGPAEMPNACISSGCPHPRNGGHLHCGLTCAAKDTLNGPRVPGECILPGCHKPRHAKGCYLTEHQWCSRRCYRAYYAELRRQERAVAMLRARHQWRPHSQEQVPGTDDSTSGCGEEFADPIEGAAQMFAAAKEGERHFQAERARIIKASRKHGKALARQRRKDARANQHDDQELTRAGGDYETQQDAEQSFQEVLEDTGGRTGVGRAGAIFRGDMEATVQGRRTGGRGGLLTDLDTRTLAMIERWRAEKQLLELTAIFDEVATSTLANKHELVAATDLVFGVHSEQGDADILVVNVYIEASQAQCRTMRHRTILLIGEREVLYYDATSLMKSESVRRSVEHIVPVLRAATEKRGKRFIHTVGQADATVQGQSRRDENMCNALSQVVMAAASLVGIAGTLAAIRCLQGLGPEAITLMARFGLAQVWRNVEAAAERGLGDLQDFMPHPVASPAARARCNVFRTQAIVSIRKRLSGLTDEGRSTRTSDRLFAIADPDDLGQRFITVGQSYTTVYHPHLAAAAAMMLQGAPECEYVKWECANLVQAWTASVDPHGRSVDSERSTRGTPQVRWASSFLGSLYSQVGAQEMKLKDAIEIASQEGGITRDAATVVLGSTTATKARERHERLATPQLGVYAVEPQTIRVSADCAGVGADIYGINEAAIATGSRRQWTSVTELNELLLNGMRKLFLSESEPPFFGSYTGCFDPSQAALNVDVAYHSPPCPPGHTASNGERTNHGTGDTRAAPSIAVARSFVRGLPTLTIVENVTGAEDQGPACFVRDVVRAAGGVTHFVSRSGRGTGVCMSSTRSFTLHFNSASQEFASDLMDRIQAQCRTGVLSIGAILGSDEFSEEYILPKDARFVSHSPTTGREDAPTKCGQVRVRLKTIANVYEGQVQDAMLQRFVRGGNRAKCCGVYRYNGTHRILRLAGMGAVMGVPAHLYDHLSTKDAMLALCNLAPVPMVQSIMIPVFGWLRDHPRMVVEGRELPRLREGLHSIVQTHLLRVSQPPQIEEELTVDSYDGVPLPRLDAVTFGGVGIAALTASLTGLVKVVGYVGKHGAAAHQLLAGCLNPVQIHTIHTVRHAKAELFVGSFAHFGTYEEELMGGLFGGDWLILQIRLHDDDAGTQLQFEEAVQEQVDRLRPNDPRIRVRIEQFNTGGCGDAAIIKMTVASITRGVVADLRGGARVPQATHEAGAIVTSLVSVGELLRTSPPGSRLVRCDDDKLTRARRLHPARQELTRLVDGRAVIGINGPDEWPYESVIGDSRMARLGSKQVSSREWLARERLALFGIHSEENVETILGCTVRDSHAGAKGADTLLSLLLEEVTPGAVRILTLRLYQTLVPCLQDAAKRSVYGGSTSTRGASEAPRMGTGERCVVHGSLERTADAMQLEADECFKVGGKTYRVAKGTWVTLVAETYGRHERSQMLAGVGAPPREDDLEGRGDASF